MSTFGNYLETIDAVVPTRCMAFNEWQDLLTQVQELAGSEYGDDAYISAMGDVVFNPEINYSDLSIDQQAIIQNLNTFRNKYQAKLDLEVGTTVDAINQLVGYDRLDESEKFKDSPVL